MRQRRVSMDLPVALGISAALWRGHSNETARLAVVSRATGVEWEGPGPAGPGSPMAAGWWNLRRDSND